MLTYKTFSVWIEIDGAEAKEYDVQTVQDGGDGVPSVTCWIASESGKQFTVYYKDSNPINATVSRTYVDGRPADSGKLTHQNQTDYTCSTSGFRISREEVKPFVFGDILLTDDDQYLYNSISPDFGSISVSVEGCVVLYATEFRTPNYDASGSESLIHERAKKGVSHQVRAAQAKCQPAGTQFQVDYTGKIVKFVFKYRTMDQLIANDITPRPATRRQAPTDDVIDISSDSEYDGLADEEASLEARLAEIRRRRAKKRVKREPEVKEEGDVKPRLLSGEVIDLT